MATVCSQSIAVVTVQIQLPVWVRCKSLPPAADCARACLPASHYSHHHPDPEEHRSPGRCVPVALHPGCLPLHDDYLPCSHCPLVQQVHTFT